MTADEFKDWLKRHKLTWRQAALTLDCDISQIGRYAGGQTPIPRYRERDCMRIDGMIGAGAPVANAE